MRIKSIVAKAFRCFGIDDNIFDFVNDRTKRAANLVVIYAPNGFGKTSLLDAIEFAFTGKIKRFDLGGLPEAIDVDKKLCNSDYTYLHNKQFPNQEIKVEIEIEDAEPVIRCIKQEEEETLIKDKNTDNQYISDVILPQEWFDAFLSSENAEQRFHIFLNYFYKGRDLLRYREEILQARRIASKKTSELAKQREELGLRLKNNFSGEEVNILIGQYRTLVAEGFCMEGWKDEVDEKSLSFSRSWAENQIKWNVNQITGIRNQIKEINNDELLIAWNQKKEEEEQCVKRRDALREQKERAKKCQQCEQSLENIKSAIIDTENRLKDCLFLYDNADLYNEYIDKKIAIERNKEQLSTKMNEFTNQLNLITERDKSLLKKRNEIDSEIEKYNKNIKETDSKAKEKNEKEIQLKTNNEILKKITESKEKYNQKNDATENRLKKLEEIREKIENDGIGILKYGLFPDKECLIIEKKKQLAIHEQIIKKYKDTIEETNKYLTEVNRLVNNSYIYLTDNHTSICPLCGHDYGGENELMRAISANGSVSNAVGLLMENLDHEEKKKDAINVEIASFVSEYVNLIEAEIGKCQAGIMDIYTELANLNEQETQLSSDNNVLSDKIAEIESWFNGLEVEEFVDLQRTKIEFLEKDLKENIDVRLKLEEKARLLDGQYETLKKSFEKCCQSLEMLLTPTIKNYSELHPKKVLETEIRQWENDIEQYKHFIEQQKSRQAEVSNHVAKFHKEKTFGYMLSDVTQKFDDSESAVKSISLTLKDLALNINKTVGVFFDTQANSETLKQMFEERHQILVKELEIKKNQAELLNKFYLYIEVVEKYLGLKDIRNQYEEISNKLKEYKADKNALTEEKEKIESFLQEYVRDFFYEDVINQLYNAIDPHPKYKTLNFDCDFKRKEPRLNVIMSAQDGDNITPQLYFSTAQINILSFCIFMARAMFAKDEKGKDVGCIFVDDPIQAMDGINVLSMIDLIRNIAFTNKKQIVITTHDRNFYELLKRKCPDKLFNSKFISFKGKGRV